MALNNAGRTLCVYTGKRPVEIEDSCIYYNDTTNRNFINSKPFSYFDIDGLATLNNVVFTHTPPVELLYSATDDQVKSYFDSKLRDINSASVKYYDLLAIEDLPVFQSFSINKTELNQIINNPSKVIEFERGETYIDYVIQLNSDYSIGCSVPNGLSNTFEIYIISNVRGAGKCVEVREICRKMSDDETPYFTTNYETTIPFDTASQELTWKNAQLSIGSTRTISSRNIQGFDYTGEAS